MTGAPLHSSIPIPESPAASRRLHANYQAIGLSANPFPLDPASGAYALTSVHAPARTELLAWIAAIEQDPYREDRLGVVIGEDGTGKTRLLTELVHALGDRRRRALVSLPDTGEQPAEAHLLRGIATGLGATPTGRTGLDLMTGVTSALIAVRRDGRIPGLLIDGANFTGARLETIRNILRAATGTGLWIVLFATPDLLVRTDRRRSLRGLMGPRVELEPLTEDDARLVIDTRVASTQIDPDGELLIAAEARTRMIRWSEGNAGKLVYIAGEAVVEAIAQGRSSVDERIVQKVERELADEERQRSRNEPVDTDGTRPVQATMPLLSDGNASRTSSATTQQGLWEDEHQ